MSAPTGLGQAPLCVALDLRHPFSYLALRPAIDFARELAIEIDWLPLEGQPLRAPSKPAPNDDRGARHRRHRANMIAREIGIYARAQGLTLRAPYRDGTARAAHLAWLWVRAHAPDALPAFLEALFRRYWALELDAGELAEVVAVLDGQGLNTGEFGAWADGEGVLEAERVASALREAGVSQAPAYVVGDEIFYGRQHLPMIRWILDGRTGPVPI